MIKKEDLLPPQHIGEESNTERSIECKNIEEARRLFEKAEQRLFNINKWHEYAGAMTAEFGLCDKDGKEINRMPVRGDHFKIDIPGPGPSTGDGFDWVKVEAVERIKGEDEEVSLIKVRPATNPTNIKTDVAHFFDQTSSSSFLIKRKENIITAGVYGRNEQPNTDADGLIDRARNTAVAAVAISIFSKYQWKSLVEGLLDIQ